MRNAIRLIVLSTWVATWVGTAWVTATFPAAGWVGALSVAATVVGLWGCSDREPHSSPRPPAPRTGYTETEVTSGGSVYGRVTWAGERPPEVVGPMGEGCADSAPVGVLEVGPRGGVAGTVVVLNGIHEGRALSTAPRDFNFSECHIEPHVVALERGAMLRLHNADPMLHNARALSTDGATRFDLAVPAMGPEVTVTLDRAEILRVVDDAGHPGTLGWVHVIEHPYFAVTDDTGTFRLTDVPAGNYTLMVWHEGVRARGADGSGRPSLSPPIVLSRGVAVALGQDTPADFQLDLSAATEAGGPLSR